MKRRYVFGDFLKYFSQKNKKSGWCFKKCIRCGHHERKISSRLHLFSQRWEKLFLNTANDALWSDSVFHLQIQGLTYLLLCLAEWLMPLDCFLDPDACTSFFNSQFSSVLSSSQELLEWSPKFETQICFSPCYTPHSFLCSYFKYLNCPRKSATNN